MTKQIPTWSDALLNVDPQAPNIHELKQNAIAQEIYELRTRLAEVEKDGRAIRRMLCVSVAHMPYMDDGEASDKEIDFLRDSPADIEKKLMERNLKKYAVMKEQA